MFQDGFWIVCILCCLVFFCYNSYNINLDDMMSFRYNTIDS